MMQTDVKSAYVDSATTVYAAPTRVRGIYVYTSGVGTLELSDGGSGGTVKLKLAFPASATNNPFYIPIPGEGVRFEISVYAKTMTNVAAITVFHG
jgi:hypothetical protein